MRFSGKFWPLYVKADAIVFTDRYGGDYPDPETMCHGQCEGMGWVPIQLESLDPSNPGDQVFQQLFLDDPGEPDEMGFKMITCPECGGSGEQAKEISPAMEAIMEAVGEASMAWNPKPGEQVFDSTEAADIARRLADTLGIASAKDIVNGKTRLRYKASADPAREYLDMFRRMEAGQMAWQVFDAKVEAMAAQGNDPLSKAIRRCRHRDEVVMLFRKLVRDPGKGALLDVQANLAFDAEVAVEDLSPGTIKDIAEQIETHFPELGERGWTSEDIAETLKAGLVGLPKVVVEERDPNYLKDQFDSFRKVSKAAVKKYTAMVKSGVVFDPVILKNGEFLDGGHRVEAYIAAGKDSIPTIDIGPLLDEDWFDILIGGKIKAAKASRILAYGDRHEWGCLMADLPADVADKIKAWTKTNVAEGSLYNSEDPKEYGYEHTIHTTAAYGIDPKTDRGALEALLMARKPPEIKLGAVSKFRPEDKPYEVLKIEVGGKDMPALNKAIADEIGVPGNTFPDYRPHVTLAYVRPGECEDLVGEEPFRDALTLTAFSYTAPEEEGGRDKKTEWTLGAEVKASSIQFLLAHIERRRGTGLGILAGRNHFYKAPWVGPPCLTSPDVADLLWALRDLLRVDAEYRQNPRLDITYLDPEELATMHDHIGMLEAEMHRRYPTGDNAFSAGGHIYAGKKTIVWDFDGTIAEDVGFPAFGAPRPDIIALMRLAADAGIENVIQSCRWSVHELSTPESAAQQMVEAIAWLEANDVPYDRLEADKQLGVAYVDDKGFNVTDPEAIKHMIAENASGFPVDGGLVMTASDFDEMRDRALELVESDPGWRTILTDPAGAQAFGALQKAIKDSRDENSLRLAWSQFVDLPWDLVAGSESSPAQ